MSSQSALPDVQSEVTHPARPEILAGIDRVRVRLAFAGNRTATAVVTLTARVPEGHRGVHMSRLYRMLAPDGGDLPLAQLRDRIASVAVAQETAQLVATVAWEDLVERAAPVTGSVGFHPYRVELRATWTRASGVVFRTRVENAAMLACPCSKALSGDLGFHNQRGILQAEVDGNWSDRIDTLLDALDKAASNRVHPVLRREDEKEVIDILSRDNSFRFVEDAATRLLDLLDAAGHTGTSIHVRSMESIHAHDAVAWAGTRGQDLAEGILLR
jgi:GTP cyclohydrolase IB